MELNDSPEIPDRGETSNIPGLPSGIVSYTDGFIYQTTKSGMTQIYIKQNIHKHWTPVEKAHKARTRWYRGPLRRFINTRF